MKIFCSIFYLETEVCFGHCETASLDRWPAFGLGEYICLTFVDVESFEAVRTDHSRSPGSVVCACFVVFMFNVAN